MAEPRQYRLLKDLPGLKAGAVGRMDWDEDNEFGEITFFTDDGDVIEFSDNIVENNPDWFQPIPQPPVSPQKVDREGNIKIVEKLTIGPNSVNEYDIICKINQIIDFINQKQGREE